MYYSPNDKAIKCNMLNESSRVMSLDKKRDIDIFPYLCCISKKIYNLQRSIKRLARILFYIQVVSIPPVVT